MSQTASLSSTIILQRPVVRRSMLGLGISLLLHVLAVGWLWHSGLSPRADEDTGPARQMAVRLVPAAPEPTRAAPVPTPAPAPARAQNETPPLASPTQARGSSKPTEPQRQPRADMPSPGPAVTAIETPDEAATGTDAGPHPAADSGAATSGVNLAAARATARLVARERGNGMLATESRKPVVDPNADRRVVSPLERARRVDCQTARAESTNLLANVVLLAVDLAKNAIDDSGCKW